ncbi:MAG: efflux RND transporter periplasmic adaptor subunit [Xanthomonadales bacterium]|nr:efflux RND transporter periplasmic adaptor subunit [Xanthomonadales bacterium]
MSRIGTIIMVIATLALGIGIGMWIEPGQEAESGSNGSGEREILYWVAPMDPNFRRDGPGKSPMGMDLVPVYADEAQGSGDAVTISPAVEQNLGVRTAVVEAGKLWRLIRATGYVDYDESLISHVHLRTEGWVEDLAVATLGETVRAGTVIAEVYSPELVNAQKEYLAALRRGQTAITEAAGEKLRALGMTDGQIRQLGKRGSVSQTFEVAAPRDGVVTEMNVREGMYVTPATIVFSIADLGSVWVHAAVFESQSAWVREGQPAEMTLEALPGRTFEGEVVFIDPVLDPDTRTLQVRLRFDNPERALKPNMFAAVKIYGGALEGVLSIPAEALIRGAERDRVVVALGDGRFQAREVVTGIRSGDWIEIREGLSAGDRVVTSAQFLIDSEASLSGSLKRLEDSRRENDRGPWNVSGRLVGKEGTTATIEHDPVEALGWPAMTMDFQLADAEVAAAAEPGDSIHFQMVKTAEGTFLVRQIHVMDGSMQP